MKKMNNKGFTIVELVIVIAVIAILAAVMIPTFSGVVQKANTSAAIQKAKAIHAEYVANVNYGAGDVAADVVYIQVDSTEYVKFADDTLGSAVITMPATTEAGAYVITLPAAGGEG